MSRYLIRRFLLMIPTLFFVAVVVFALMRMIPGDPVELKMLGDGSGEFSPEQLMMERERYGLNDPTVYQFANWFFGILKLDFGVSILTDRRVSEDIAIALPLSLQIALMSTFLATLLAIPLGTLAALRQDTWVDYIVRIFSIAGIATPSFWLGIMMIIGILVITGSSFWPGETWAPPFDYKPIWVDPGYNLSMLIWPALATGYRYSAVAMRMVAPRFLRARTRSRGGFCPDADDSGGPGGIENARGRQR